MVLKKWNEIIHSDLGAYSPDKTNDNILHFPKELSPLTNFSLDIFANVISQKNLIINFPDFKLKPASLYAYIFANEFNQSSYILADEKGDSLNRKSNSSLNKNHYLLCDYGNFIFHQLPVFYLKKLKESEKNSQNNSVKYKLTLEKYLPRATRTFKNKYTEKSVLDNEINPKLIIDTDNKLHTIKEKIEIILKTNDSHINTKKFPIGLIIIENADRFFRSLGRLENFVTWFKKLNSDVKLLIHFNNPSIDYIKLLIKELNFTVLPLNKYIIENNDYLKNTSEEYFNTIEPSKLELLNRYNIDSNNTINKKPNISIYNPLIKSGTIDNFFINAYNTFKKININKVFNQYSLHKSLEILFDFYNLTVNPSYLTIPFNFNNRWIYGSIPHFIQNFKNRLNRENPKNRFLIYDFIDSLNNMYSELSSCKRVNEDLSYFRKSKDYILYELLLKLLNEGEKIFVGTYLNTEPAILKSILEKGINLKIDSVIPISMNMLIQKQDNEKENKILVLPGVIPEVFVSELFKPYKKIIILSYEGINNEMLKKQLETVIFGNILEEKEYMEYLKEMLEKFNVHEGNEILDDFNKRFDLIEFKEENTEEPVQNQQEIEETSQSIFSINLNLNEYMDEWKKSKSNLNVDLSNEINSHHYDTVSFRLQNIKTQEFVEKKLPINKSYLTFNNIHNIDDAKELKPSELNSGDYIIIIDNDEKKSLLNLVIDVSNIKEKINMDLIEYWKLEFLNYIESNKLKYSEIHNIYLKKGGTKTYQTVMQWCKGEIMGPQSSEDLYIIGKILDNSFIIENYQLIFNQINLVRTSHRAIGRKLKKMIKSILTDEYLDISKLNDNEYKIFENIQNGIYKIV